MAYDLSMIATRLPQRRQSLTVNDLRRADAHRLQRPRELQPAPGAVRFEIETQRAKLISPEPQSSHQLAVGSQWE